MPSVPNRPMANDVAVPWSRIGNRAKPHGTATRQEARTTLRRPTRSLKTAETVISAPNTTAPTTPMVSTVARDRPTTVVP